MLKQKILFILLVFSLVVGVHAGLNNVALAASTPDPAIQSGDFMFDLRSITHEDIRTDRLIGGGINYVFLRIITILAGTVGAAAVFMIVLGGFLIITSGGAENRITLGKGLIFKALIGLVFVLGAYVIVTTIQFLISSIYA